MASTVNVAFSEFMRDTVNLDSEVTKKARKSRDNLIVNINDLGEDDSFFNLYSEKNISFGSFARKTKIRPLNDIDIMICIKGDGSTYSEYSDRVEITVNDDSSPQKACCNDNSSILNSTKVINKFKSNLSNLPDYKKAELHKNGSAATLQMNSYSWNFDIVPCFFTAPTSSGDTFYIIPDGKGNWIMTDPRKDRDGISDTNQTHNGRMLDTIRLLKYWNNRSTMPSAPSYMFECLILQYFKSLQSVASEFIDLRFRDALNYIRTAIYYSVDDPKGIQGNLNTLTTDEQYTIAVRATNDYNKAVEAVRLEVEDKDHKSSIRKWGEIFGSAFPTFSD